METLKVLGLGKGVKEDVIRRFKHYPSDFKDGLIGGPKTIEKVLKLVEIDMLTIKN